MRLSNRIKNIILKSIENSFGNVDTYLFGSRVDDTKIGGDIDIAIDVTLDNNEFRKNKVLFLRSLMIFRLDDLKVDLVSYNTTDSLLYQEIRNNSIKLIK